MIEDKEAISSVHDHWMYRCIDLARQARGQTSPNPMVGSVIVKNGEVLGEGFHPKQGNLMQKYLRFEPLRKEM